MTRWTVMVAIVVVILGSRWFVKRQLRRLRWLAVEQPPPRPPAVVRWAEAGIVALVSAAWLVTVVYRARLANVPWLWADALPTPIRREEITNLALATIGVITGVLWLGWRGRSALILAGVATCLVMAGIPVTQGTALFNEPDENSDRPIVIRCFDETVGADVFINGEHIGRTPCETTLHKLREVAKRSPKPALPDIGHGHLGAYFHTPDGELLFDATQIGPYPSQDCGYASLTLNGEAAKLRLSGYPSARWRPALQSWLPGDAVLFTHFPERERRWKELLDQIRLRDYETTTPEWLKALDSFGMPGQFALEKAIKVEPGFQTVFDAWAAWKYGLHPELSFDSAWQVLERLIAESDNVFQRYERRGLRIRALELLAPHLDPRRLTAEITWCLSQHVWRDQDWGKRWPFVDLTSLAVDLSWDTDASRPEALRSIVLNHLVWFLSQSDSGRPFVEQTIVPLLLRYGHTESARHLGGAVFRQFAARSLKRKLSDPTWLKNEENMIASGDGDRWLLTDPSEVAREWRRRNESLLFQAADHLVDRSWEPLAFILEDFRGQTDHRVWRYWQHMRNANPHPSVGLAFVFPASGKREWLWNFLDRLGPHAPVSAYVEAWKLDPIVKNSDALSLYRILRIQSLDQRTEILRELAKLVGPPPENPDGTGSDPQGEIARSLARNIEASQFTDEEQQRNFIERHFPNKTLEQRRSELAYFLRDSRKKLQTGELRFSFIRLLAQSSVAESRLVAVEFLAAFPIPELRPLLSPLLEDTVPEVQKSAQDLQAKLNELANQSPIVWSAN